MKINIGGQKGIDNFPKGWTTVDMRDGADIRLNLIDSPLPFQDNEIESIYTSHTLEHIFPDRIYFVLKECRRVLKQSGIMRIVVPDIDVAIKLYINQEKKIKNKDNPTKMKFLPDFPIYYLSSWFFSYSIKENERVFTGHVNVFTKETMEFHLRKVGFSNIHFKKYNKCSKDFIGCDFERYKESSIYVECCK